MIVVIVLLVLVERRDLDRTVVRLLDILRVAALHDPVLALPGRAGAALVKRRAPLAVEIRHLHQTVPAVVHIETRGQRLQIDYRAVHDVLLVEVDAMVLVDGFPAHDCESIQISVQ